MGSLYRKKRKQPDGSLVEEQTFWVKYYQAGRAIRESTGTDKEQEAKRFLKMREGAVATGQPLWPRADRVRYYEAAAALRAHYTTTGSRNLVEAEKRLKHLDAFFRGRRLVSIGGAEATAYVAHRQTEGAANGTANRELSLVRKARPGAR